MAQNYYLVRCDNVVYANEELFTVAVAKGERAFIKMLAHKAVVGKKLLGETIYPLTDEQRRACAAYQPVVQDFDDAFKHFNVLFPKDVAQAKDGCNAAFPGALVLVAGQTAIPELFKYRQVSFFKVSAYREAKKYAMTAKMATVKICGRLYVALNTVNVRVETPIIVTMDR
jgi:hypothetical protein